jgi:ATP-dependent RNA helicase DeaD
LVNKKALDLSKAKCLVLDEADEMLSRGFKDDIEKIFSFIAKEHKTWLFSATIPKQLEDVISNNLTRKALRIQIERKNIINENIKHSYVRCEVDDKVKILISYIKAHKDERGVVFTRTREGTKKLTHILQTKKISCDAIHGDLLQKERDKALRQYKKDEFKVLIATDVAARGIDIDDIAYVIHFQLPEIPENYVHRSGRTARAGKKGEAISFVADSERNQLASLSSKYGIDFEEIV